MLESVQQEVGFRTYFKTRKRIFGNQLRVRGSGKPFNLLKDCVRFRGSVCRNSFGHSTQRLLST